MTQRDHTFGSFKERLKFAVHHCSTLKARPLPPKIIEETSDEETAPDPDFPFASPRHTVKKADHGDCDDEMGKSNKFDYTNKNSTGISLGHFIAKQLDSEASKVQKNAERDIIKARKQSISSSTGSSDIPDSFVHQIDLKIPGKDLGDDGFGTLADGLEIALRKGTDQASLALEDVNLCDNGLTAASLARLAPIIELAKYDIKTLNLASNDIKVVTDEEAAQWEVFLRAFRSCFKLQRLDLSGNGGLGGRAMEIFAKVHIREEAISPIAPGGDASVYSLVSDQGGEDEDNREMDKLPAAGAEDGDTFGRSLSKARLLRKRSGLRSIPFITLRNIGLTDTGALWLSYVLEDHYYPNQLVDQLNATLHDSTIKAYQQGQGVHGIDWDGSAALLTKDGVLLLNRTESLRRQTLLDDDQSMLAESLVIEEPGESAEDVSHTLRRPVERRGSRAIVRDRRASVRSIRTVDGGEHEATELESLRKKIQRHIIAEVHGVSVDLWRSSLRLLHCARIFMYAAPTERTYYTGEALFSMPSAQTVAVVQQPTPSLSPSHDQRKLSIDTAKAFAYAKAGRGSYAATLTATSGAAPGEPELAITEVTNTPTTPKMIFKAHRKGAFSEGTDLIPVTDKLNGLIMRDESPERFVRYQQRRVMATGLGRQAFRDTATGCHLPKKVMDYIISFVLKQAELDVMTEEQKGAVVAWGFNRSTLTVEREWMRKDESNQVWMLLDSIKCLAYAQ
ncbi:hypothetical protein LTR85_007338 [Meristemomyces frigidus]|nr:hypothetical protein LTR85_007338 [Meristemomyces frigidus]